MSSNIINFEGIKFYNYSIDKILKKMITKGGILVAPAASSLSKIHEKKDYFNALKSSQVAIFDSGFFCILLRVFKNIKVKKLSGYLFMKHFLETAIVKKKILLSINPSPSEGKKNLKFLNSKKFKLVFNYTAPNYDKSNLLNDKKLFNLIDKIKPEIILINIGGEKQEILAYNIYKNSKDKKIFILCLGAAIAFFTGEQPRIGIVSDKIYLGWFVRWIGSPIKYLPRVISSFKLIKLFI